jgi:hypothetical protein
LHWQTGDYKGAIYSVWDSAYVQFNSLRSTNRNYYGIDAGNQATFERITGPNVSDNLGKSKFVTF